ncbi:MAG TPA: sigma-70 family RNA polymerase sigma factor [Bryobacteraceae bacterium]
MAPEPVETVLDDQSRLARLLSQVAERDEQALAKLYDETSRIVYGLALRMVRDPSAAEDITLEVYLQVWRRAGLYLPGRATVTSWLAMLARSRSIDWLRSPQARLAQQSNPLDEVEAFRDAAPDPEHACVDAAHQRAVRRGIEDLAPEQRQVIELAFFSGLSHSEIAGRLGQPLGTVKSRIRAGMSQLRVLVVRYLGVVQ